ncbi:MAG: CHASE2 domain-containing protein [Anaerolineae bacterium]|nr:CHASE2 domain-containing protein [Anaerolineae bacterium]
MRHTSTVWRKTRLVMMAGAGGFIALLCLLIWGSGLMMSIRLRLNDVYYTPAPTTNTVVIIAADDASLARYGRTPAQWSRQVYADLARRLENVGARVVALDFLLSQPQPEDEAVAAAFAALRQNEARTRIVFAEAGVNTVSAPPSGNRLMFAERLSLTPILQSIPDYRGYVNALPDTDGVLRRLPSQLQIDDRREMSFSTAIYLAYLRIPSQALDQVVQTEGSELLLTPQRRVPVDALGLWQPYYFADTGNAFVVVPLNDVLDGKVSPELFRDKIVLVGLMNTTGTLDEYLVPSSLSGSLMAGVEIQAHAVESLLQGKIIRPLPTLAQAALLVGLAMLASLAYALPRWTAKLALAGGLLLVYIVAASVVFSLTQFSVSLLDGFIALLLPVLASIGVDITLETRRRQQTEFLLGSLQRIAQQRLRLPQAAEYILEDIERVVGESDPTLYIRDPFDEGRSTRFRRGQPPQDETAIQTDSLAYRHRAVRALTRSDGQTLVPLMWQGRQLGLLHIAHRAKRLDRTTEAVLGRFCWRCP